LKFVSKSTRAEEVLEQLQNLLEQLAWEVELPISS